MIWGCKTRIFIFSRRSPDTHFNLSVQRRLVRTYFIHLTSFSRWPLATEGIVHEDTLGGNRKPCEEDRSDQALNSVQCFCWCVRVSRRKWYENFPNLQAWSLKLLLSFLHLRLYLCIRINAYGTIISRTLAFTVWISVIHSSGGITWQKWISPFPFPPTLLCPFIALFAFTLGSL